MSIMFNEKDSLGTTKTLGSMLLDMLLTSICKAANLAVAFILTDRTPKSEDK